MTKTPEEKAREYADEEWKGAWEYDEYSTDTLKSHSIEAYLSGYHSRNEEVKQLKEALKEITNALQERCDKYGMSPIEYEVSAKAKQLIGE